jgi:hypothetical protein
MVLVYMLPNGPKVVIMTAFQLMVTVRWLGKVAADSSNFIAADGPRVLVKVAHCCWPNYTYSTCNGSLLLMTPMY